jgi:hypothetical protein
VSERGARRADAWTDDREVGGVAKDKKVKEPKAPKEKKAKVKKPRVGGLLADTVTSLVLVLFLLSLVAQRMTG